MPFEPGNQTAAKPDGAKLSATVQLRTHPREKSAWVRAARPGKLTDWIRRTLNEAAGHSPEPYESPPKPPDDPAAQG